jgi:hypothetical protein
MEARLLYQYRLFYADRSEAGDAHYAVMVEPADTIERATGESCVS